MTPSSTGRSMQIKGRNKIPQGAAGFTLVELLIAVAISGIVMGGIYSVYLSQQTSYTAQAQATAMEQNVRAAVYFMQRDISMAGCDPSGTAHAGILTAESHSIRLTEDLNGNGDLSDSNEDISYYLYIPKDGIQKLGRRSPYEKNNNPVSPQPVAEGVDVLDFVYLDGARHVLPTPVSDPSKIRSVQVTLLVRSDRPDPHYLNTIVYRNQSGDVIFGPGNDHFRRRLLTVEVRCRNLAF
jgi:type IV pilus assembly protein PilW